MSHLVYTFRRRPLTVRRALRAGMIALGDEGIRPVRKHL